MFRLTRLVHHLGIESVVDVGANIGEFALELRRFGFRGRVYSFEPVAAAYGHLIELADVDPLWSAHQYALGADSGYADINIAANGARSSSILPMLQRHSVAASGANYIGTERVRIETLDDMARALQISAVGCFLKIDVQGFESAVLDGAEVFLRETTAVLIELSLVKLYEGSALYAEMLSRMTSLGYDLVHVAPGFTDLDTGETLQFDGVFARR